jgi:hypothetical protein
MKSRIQFKTRHKNAYVKTRRKFKNKHKFYGKLFEPYKDPKKKYTIYGYEV